MIDDREFILQHGPRLLRELMELREMVFLTLAHPEYDVRDPSADQDRARFVELQTCITGVREMIAEARKGK